MQSKNKLIVALTFSSIEESSDQVIDFAGEKITLIHRSADYDTTKMEKLIRLYDGNCDAICISGLPPFLNFEKTSFYHNESLRLKSLVKYTPLFDGSELKALYIPWAFRKYYLQNQQLFSKRRISFLSATFQYALLEIFSEHNHEVLIGDAYSMAKIPLIFKSKGSFDFFLSNFNFVLKRLPLNKKQVATFRIPQIPYIPKDFVEFSSAQIMVGNRFLFELLDSGLLKNKLLITDFMSEKEEAILRKAGASGVLGILGSTSEEFKKLGNYVNYSILEGLFSFLSVDQSLDTEILFRGIQLLNLSPTMYSMSEKPVIQSNLKIGVIKSPNLSTRLDNRKSGINSLFATVNGKQVRQFYFREKNKVRLLLSKHNPLVDLQKIENQLLEKCHVAHKKGASIVAIPHFLALQESGKLLIQRSPLPVTDGSALRILTGLKASFHALGLDFSNDRLDHVVIFGVNQKLGHGIAKFLAGKTREMTLIGTKMGQILTIHDELVNQHVDLKLNFKAEPAESMGQKTLIVIIQNPQVSGEGRIQFKNFYDIKTAPVGSVIFDTQDHLSIDEDDIVKRPDCLIIRGAKVLLQNTPVELARAEALTLCEAGKVEFASLGKNVTCEMLENLNELSSQAQIQVDCMVGHKGDLPEMEIQLFREHAREHQRFYAQPEGRLELH